MPDPHLARLTGEQVDPVIRVTNAFQGNEQADKVGMRVGAHGRDQGIAFLLPLDVQFLRASAVQVFELGKEIAVVQERIIFFILASWILALSVRQIWYRL